MNTLSPVSKKSGVKHIEFCSRKELKSKIPVKISQDEVAHHGISVLAVSKSDA